MVAFFICFCGCSDDADTPDAGALPRDAAQDTAASKEAGPKKEAGPGKEAGPKDSGPGACTSDKQCTATKQVCDLLLKKCVDCLLDNQCAKNQHCVSRKCVSYTPCKNSLDCVKVKGKPICSKILSECVACDADTDCSANFECVKHTCVAFTPCKNSKDCTNQVCHTAKGKCVDCLAKTDCKANQDCVANKCKTYYPCKSDKDCTPKGMLCDKAAGRCKVCLKHADCPATYHCKAGECLLDICAPTQSQCVNNGVAKCNATGDAFDAPASCGKQKCVQTGLTAKCDKWVCKPACAGNTDTCDQGTCKCGSAPPCTSVADTCTSGVCKCGAGSACAGNADICVSGVCKCGINAACSGAADTCAKGVCKCGTAAPCSGVSDTCAGGVCKCGAGPACSSGQTCVKGKCHTCTGDLDCNDGLTCTKDTCNKASGTCSNNLVAGNCLINGKCHAAGAINPANGCDKCTPATSTSQWDGADCGTVVYVTTATNDGKFGGRNGLDGFCSNKIPPGLKCKNIHALISTSLTDDIASMPTAYGYKATKPLYWYNPAGFKFTKFATNWADMLDGSITVSRKSGTGVDKFAWTGTTNAGKAYDHKRYHCGKWTNDVFGNNWKAGGNSLQFNLGSGVVSNPTAVANWLATVSTFATKTQYGPKTCCVAHPGSPTVCNASCPSSSTASSDVLMCGAHATVMCACELY